MSKREYMLRYMLIIQKLRNGRMANFEEISDYLDHQSEIQGYEFRISKRTFQRDIDEIYSLFKIEIKFDFSKKLYYTVDEEQEDLPQRFMEAFDLFNSLKVAQDNRPYIYPEKRRPLGTENLYGLIHSIRNQFQVLFNYYKFEDDEIYEHTVNPIALKEFKHRWYLMATIANEEGLRTFALDRLTDLEISKKKAVYTTEYNIENHFRNCFGIFSPNSNEPDELILSFDPYQGKYIKTFPLHHTQEIITDTEKEFRIRLKLYSTYDLLMELLSFGQTLTVIAPLKLKEEMKMVLEKALGNYKK